MDGVLFDTETGHNFYLPDRFGFPVHGAREFLRELRKIAHVVIFTARFCDAGRQHFDLHHLKSIVEEALLSHELEYDEIWTGVGKPVALAYVDDRAVACRPLEHTSSPACFSETLSSISRLMADDGLPSGLADRGNS
jgi:hypothetical protein